MKNFIASPRYRALLDRVVSITGIEVAESVSTRMLELDVARLANAGLTLEDIEQAANSETSAILPFVVLKMQKYGVAPLLPSSPRSHAHSGEVGQTVAVGPFLPNFLTLYLIEYVLVGLGTEQLESYLKRSRIPNAKRYARELHTLFGEASNPQSPIHVAIGGSN